MQGFVFAAMLLLLSGATSTPLMAQDNGETTDTTKSDRIQWYVGMSGGPSSMEFSQSSTSFGSSAGISKWGFVASVGARRTRYADHSRPGFLFGGTTVYSSITDYRLMIGVAPHGRSNGFSASIGLAHVTGSGPAYQGQSSIGLPVEVGADIYVTSWLGIGANLFVTINDVATTSGVGLNCKVGDLTP